MDQEQTTVLLPSDPEEIDRWEESARRRRMLDGTWGRDLLTYMAGVLNVLRTSSIGKPSRAINLYRSTVEQLAVHYHEPARVSHESDDDTTDDRTGQAGPVMSDLLAKGQIWPTLRRHEEYTIGLRESLIFVGWSESLDAPRLRLVTPDTVVVTHAPGDPHELRTIREARWRGDVQLWDVWSLDDERGFWVEDAKGADVTAEVLGEVPAWEWVAPDGSRYLPWHLSHATYTGALWDAYAWCEMVDGAFDVAVCWNHWHKAVRDASWAQRWGLGVTVQGGAARGSGETSARHVTTAPDSVLLFSPSDPGSAGSLGQFDSPIDPDVLANAILQFSRTLLSSIGIHPADVERTEGASSGYAIQLRRSAQRRLAMSAEPMRRAADLELMTLIAREAGRHGYALPDEGWSITYSYPDEGAAEQTEALTLDVAMVAAGVLTPVAMYQRWNPGVSEDAAARALVEAAAQRYALAPENVGKLIAADAVGVGDLREAAKGDTTSMEESNDGRRDDGDGEQRPDDDALDG
jgi:hypothetical protein